MRLSKNLIDKLKHLYAGGSIAASALKGHWVDELLSERILFTETHGSRRSYRVRDKEAFMLALSLYNEALRDLGQARSLLDSDGSPERSLQAAMTGNSKIMRKGSCPGFPVNSYSPVVSILNGQPFTINPPEGSFIFISDWECFSIPRDVVVVGIENMENFRYIRRQRNLFSCCIPVPENQLLFVSRYPQSDSLRDWLVSIPNRYIHFGDFDLEGIAIYQNSFAKFLPGRCEFLIPSDIGHRLATGSRLRYDQQYSTTRSVRSEDPRLQTLIDMINLIRRCVDQEAYIKPVE